MSSGLGLGLVYSSTNLTIGFYFHRLRGLASGLSNSFQGLGILAGPLIFQVGVTSWSLIFQVGVTSWPGHSSSR